MKFGLGQSALREEDKRFLRGEGRHTDDIDLPNQAQSYILRSPHAHVRIRAIDTRAAIDVPGVLAVYTGEDIANAGLGDLPCFIAKAVPLERPDGQPIFVPPHPALAHGKVAFVGDCVAVVVAETRDQARNAAVLIVVDYEALPANTATRAALAEEARAVWEACPDRGRCCVSVLALCRVTGDDRCDGDETIRHRDGSRHCSLAAVPSRPMAYRPLNVQA